MCDMPHAWYQVIAFISRVSWKSKSRGLHHHKVELVILQKEIDGNAFAPDTTASTG